MNMATAFPDYPASDLPAIPSDWRDDSWHNDTCPRFTVGNDRGRFVTVWIDYKNPHDREIAESPRFSVNVQSMIEDSWIDVFASDDWQEILDRVQVERIAGRFADILESWLSPVQWFTTLDRNCSVPAGVCASHDFCDANMAMQEAWEEITGREIPFADDGGMTQADCDLWGAAWEAAKATHLTCESRDPAFLAWLETGREVASLMAAACGYEGETDSAGYVFKPGYLEKRGENWGAIIGNIEREFSGLPTAAAWLWRDYAKSECASMEAALIAEYGDWLKARPYRDMCAEELSAELAELDVPADEAWLADFSRRWNAALNTKESDNG